MQADARRCKRKSKESWEKGIGGKALRREGKAKKAKGANELSIGAFQRGVFISRFLIAPMLICAFAFFALPSRLLSALTPYALFPAPLAFTVAFSLHSARILLAFLLALRLYAFSHSPCILLAFGQRAFSALPRLWLCLLRLTSPSDLSV